MKRIISIALTMALSMSLAISNAYAVNMYEPLTLTTYQGTTYQFEAARFDRRELTTRSPVTYELTTEEREVLLLKPGSQVTVTAPDGVEPGAGGCVYIEEEGLYQGTGKLQKHTTGKVDDWFVDFDYGGFLVEYEQEKITNQFNMTYTKTLHRRTISLLLDDGQTHTENPNIFIDVSGNSYYAAPVMWAAEKGVAAGTGEFRFSPDATCTNAHILTFLWKAKGAQEPVIQNPFSNITADNYYYKPALWAYEKGLIDGSVFDANAPCTRSSTVLYLWKLAGKPAVPNTGKFVDVTSDAPYAQAVSWAVANGITSGTSENTFSPDKTCTRAQIVTFLSNDDERVNGKHEPLKQPDIDDGVPAFYKIIENMVPHPEKPGIYWHPSTGVMFDPEHPWGLMYPF